MKTPDRCTKDIMSVPAAIRIDGKKKITVKGIWAYAQRLDGMTIYRYSETEGLWYVWKEIIATNF